MKRSPSATRPGMTSEGSALWSVWKSSRSGRYKAVAPGTYPGKRWEFVVSAVCRESAEHLASQVFPEDDKQKARSPHGAFVLRNSGGVLKPDLPGEP